jgi:hypothetical protein
MVATTVTPEIVRVVFLRKMGKRRFSSFGVKRLIKSAFDGTSWSWYLPAVFIFSRLASSRVGFAFSIRVLMISLRAFSSVKVEDTKIRLSLVINKLN